MLKNFQNKMIPPSNKKAKQVIFEIADSGFMYHEFLCKEDKLSNGDMGISVTVSSVDLYFYGEMDRLIEDIEEDSDYYNNFLSLSLAGDEEGFVVTLKSKNSLFTNLIKKHIIKAADKLLV